MPKANPGGERAVRVINNLTHTSGPFANQPFNLRPWQRRIVRELFKTKKDGLRQYRTSLFMVPRKNGKALALDTEVPTPNGYVRMGDLQVGDSVFGPDGRPAAITFATEPMLDHPCFRVTFSDGASIVADAEHLWTVFDIWRERAITVTTETLAVSYRIGKRPRHREHRYRIPVAAPLQCPDREYVIDPYALGVWLGDGHTASAVVTTADDQVLELLAAVGETTHLVPSSVGKSAASAFLIGRASHRNRDREFTFQARLRQIGVLHNKHVPAEYLCGSIDQRYALLRGLMDTDGSVAYSGLRRVPRCEFSTTNDRLAADAVTLIASLGMKPTTLTYEARINGKDCGPVYRVCFTAYADQPVFGLDRKRARLARRPDRPARSSTRSIVDVMPVDSVPVRCIKVDRDDGLFLVGRTCIATHNTEIAAAIAVYGLLFDGEIGGQVYSAAADRDQASLVFHVAAQMIRNDPELEAQVEILESQKRIVHRKSGSFYRAISAEAYSKHGFSASLVIYDELASAPDRELFDVLNTSMGARSQPLMLCISTAGYDRHSILWELYQHAKRVAEKPALDPTFLPVIYEMPAEADWTDEREWKKCNPALGDFRSLEDMRIAAARAKEIPAQENTFRRLFCNQWTEQASRWVQMTAWDACQLPIPRVSLRGRRCFVGMDLSSTKDLTALVAVFPDDDGFDVLAHFFVPQDNIRERATRDRVPYDQWVRDGVLTATAGNVVDYEAVRHLLQDWAAEFQVREIAYDPWNATDLVTRLQEQDGFTCVPIRQGFASLSAPTKALEKAILSKTLRHDGHPVLRWNMSNIAVESDPTGNLKLSKKVSTERIDGGSALVMALDRLARTVEQPVGVLAEWL